MNQVILGVISQTSVHEPVNFDNSAKFNFKVSKNIISPNLNGHFIKNVLDDQGYTSLLLSQMPLMKLSQKHRRAVGDPSNHRLHKQWNEYQSATPMMLAVWYIHTYTYTHKHIHDSYSAVMIFKLCCFLPCVHLN